MAQVSSAADLTPREHSASGFRELPASSPHAHDYLSKVYLTVAITHPGNATLGLMELRRRRTCCTFHVPSQLPTPSMGRPRRLQDCHLLRHDLRPVPAVQSER